MSQASDRIARSFEQARQQGRAALIPYIAAGDPSPGATVGIMHALVQAGADIIELGVPFSDPMADGPVIQRAAERAIAQGVGLKNVLQMVAEFRQQDSQTPVVLMGYANPVERMGQAAFVQAASQAGVDGVLSVDYPPEEIDEFAALLDQGGIAPIFLLAPTSTEARIQAMAKVARGYVYYVSLKGVTGTGTVDTDEVAARLAGIRRHISLPLGVGFGIRDAQTARRIGQVADAVVIGSKLIETMEQAVAGVPADAQAATAARAASDWLKTIHVALQPAEPPAVPA